jgi:flagellar biosynthesis protein FlhF
MSQAAGNVRTFTGATMAEALGRVRAELGNDAVILLARSLNGQKWWGGRDCAVEITAGAPVDIAEAAPVHCAAMPARTRAPEPLAIEVAELRGVVEEMRRLRMSEVSTDSEVIAPLREALVGQGLPEELVTGLLTRVDYVTGVSGDAAKARRSLLSLIERLIATSGPTRTVPRRTMRIALIGPTGVGKTTTIAKLAANFRVREGKSVGFIAADTYRIAAVDQLKRYAELLGAPVKIVRSPDEMARAVGAFSNIDAVFIDTAGRSHRDETRMRELGRILDAARADEVHLVLSLAAERQSLFSAIDRFTPLGATRVILTKLDEAERAGVVLQASARARLPVSYLTTGQEVPDDIEVADSARLARLILDGPTALWRAAPLRRSA